MAYVCVLLRLIGLWFSVSDRRESAVGRAAEHSKRVFFVYSKDQIGQYVGAAGAGGPVGLNESCV